MLVDPVHFEPLFTPLTGHSVCYVSDWIGTTGDDLIHQAARQLFHRFGIRLTDIRSATVVAFGGGGNWGSYSEARACRERAYRIILGNRKQYQYVCGFPQSIWTDSEPVPEWFDAFYVRETASLRFCPRAIVAPDLALAYRHDEPHCAPREPFGLFLRSDDKEGLFTDWPNLGDPLDAVPRDHQAYIELAMRYEHVMTDRLHFAIAGLIARRQVTLLPNRYHKNRSMYETWLRDCGCRWRDYPLETREDAENSAL